jgi:hypothetical protein
MLALYGSKICWRMDKQCMINGGRKTALAAATPRAVKCTLIVTKQLLSMLALYDSKICWRLDKQCMIKGCVDKQLPCIKFWATQVAAAMVTSASAGTPCCPTVY